MKFGKFLKRTAEITAVVAAGAYVYGKVKKYEKEIDVDDVPKAVVNDLKETAKTRINEVVDVYQDIRNEFVEDVDDFINYKEIDKEFEEASASENIEVFEEEADSDEEESGEDDEEEDTDIEVPAKVEKDEVTETTPEPEDNSYGVVEEVEVEKRTPLNHKSPFNDEKEDELEFEIDKEIDINSRNQYVASIRNFFPYVNKNLIENVYQQKENIAENYYAGMHVKLYHLLSFDNSDDIDSFIKILDKHNYESSIVGDGSQVEITNEMRVREGALLTDIYVVANQAGVLNGNYESFSIEELD